MAKFVFLSSPMHGHVNPTLGIVRELIDRGDEVIYYLTENFRDTIVSVGATFRPYKTDVFTKLGQPTLQPNQSLPDLLISSLLETEEIIPPILDALRADQPDVIIYDFMFGWGHFIGLILQIPAIQMRSTYIFNMTSISASASSDSMVIKATLVGQMDDEAQQKLHLFFQHLRDHYQLEAKVPSFIEFLSTIEPLNIVSLPKTFQQNLDGIDERYQFVGPTIMPRTEPTDFPLAQLGTQPLLYISLGTIFNSWTDFFKICIDAFADSPWQVVMATGPHLKIEDLGPLPANFLIAPYVPQLQILAHTSIFIAHGGMNSVMESLHNAVPLINIPQMIEQSMTADQIVELGLGLKLERDDVTPETLRQAVQEIATNPSYRTKAQAFQRTIRPEVGAKRAADLIEEYGRTHGDLS